MRSGLRRLLLSQIALTFAAAVLMYAWRTQADYVVLAAFYGGGMALINSLLLAWRTRRAGAGASEGEGQPQAMGLMVGVVERFVFTLAAFALGMAVFKLDPVALLAGFALAQLGYAGAAYGSMRP